jgi:hypothetical protein
LAALLASVALGTFPNVAIATGGASISAAPIVSLGQQEFGNTATDDGKPNDACLNASDSWWLFDVSAGDLITVDYEGGVSDVYVYAPGTNDFNVNGADAIATSHFGNNDKQEFVFSAPTDGVLPTNFADYNCYDTPPRGPYDFVVYIKHAVRLSVPPISTLGLSGTLAVGAHKPDGAPISDDGLDIALQVRDAGKGWSSIGHASPSGGAVDIRYAIPSSLVRRTLRVRALATGPSYTTETSSAENVALPPALRLRLPNQHSIRRNSTLHVTAVGYDGATISDPKLTVTVEMRVARGWKSLGSRWVENSRAPVRLMLPHSYVGKSVTLRARVSGDYPRQVSASRRYQVG